VSVAVGLLLGLAVLVTVIAVLGLIVLPDAYDRLHVLGPVKIVAAGAVALAVLLSEGLTADASKAVVVWLLLLATSPVLTHATARAGVTRDRHRGALGETDWEVQR
jgi:multicomponent Na+:H+ antiporter subunit G